MSIPKVAQNDPWLEPYSNVINSRIEKINSKKESIIQSSGSLSNFATGHLYFGLHKTNDGWVIREWAPNATAIYLVGDVNNWKEQEDYKFSPLENGQWELTLEASLLKHKDLFKLSIHWNGGNDLRLPSYVKRVVQDEKTHIFSAQVWKPDSEYEWNDANFKPSEKSPLIYEAHIGMAQEDEKVGTFKEFRKKILPEIIDAGYNTLQLMAIQEHPYYGSFGYHVSNYFAVSSRFGTPDDLKKLIDSCHQAGIAVIMDIVHSHAVKNESEGLGNFDGTGYQYFHDGYRREHVAWDSLCFNYKKDEVLHFLLSNCKFWLEEYHFDGFRFDGVTSMLYLDHGLGKDFTSYDFYFDGNQDEDAITYLALANELIHEVKPSAITIAEEMSGMPGLAMKTNDGGYGFDYRMAMGTPDYWIKIIKERADEDWKVGEMFYEVSSRRADEKTISYAESHDQALVGDKTIIFRLVDKEMYFSMSKDMQNLTVDRGIALHKMIRLITLSTNGGGYLNFMGNEFGHPDWIDFPRAGNGWSYKYACRKWYLKKDKKLKYHWLSDFDKEMIALTKNYHFLEEPWCNKLFENDQDQILAYERGELLFVFNFNPFISFTDYGINVDAGKYNIILNTDSERFGGNALIKEDMIYYAQKYGKLATQSPYQLKLYIPARTAIVLKKTKPKSIFDE